MRRVALIACGASKRDAPSPARDLYTGSLFRAARRDVDGRLPWWVVSAFHVILAPATIIEPYDFRVEQIPAGRQRGLWAERVAGMLAAELDPKLRHGATPPGALRGVRVELHAGESYATPVVPALQKLGAVVEVLPPGRLELGPRLKWYAERHQKRLANPYTRQQAREDLRYADKVRRWGDDQLHEGDTPFGDPPEITAGKRARAQEHYDRADEHAEEALAWLAANPPTRPACTVCGAVSTHDFRPASSAKNREPDFEPRCDAHGMADRPSGDRTQVSVTGDTRSRARPEVSPVTPPAPALARLVDRVLATLPGVKRADVEAAVKASQTTIARAATDPGLPWGGTLFSGGGLVEIGLRGLVVPVFAVEANADIGAHYRKAHGPHIQVADVREVDYRPAFGLDYLHASPVCIRFTATRTASTHEQPLDVATAQATARALQEIRPRVFTLENVPAYAKSEAMKVVEGALGALGYVWDVLVYDAADYGAATTRKRLLLRAVFGAGPLPPRPRVTGAGDWFTSIEDLVPTFASSSLPAWASKRLDAMGVEWRRPSRPLLVMGGSATKENVPYAFSGGPAPTFKATPKERHRVLMPDGRVLVVTPRAIARVTGVPDDYPLPDDVNLAVTILGNGVPPPLVRAVFGPLVRR